MNDVFDPAKRSYVMSRIGGRGNRSTELALALAFRREGLIGWRRHIRMKPKLAQVDLASFVGSSRITVRPDFIFRAARVAVFVDGCFWHVCPVHSKMPATNVEFWRKKLEGNVARDQRTTRALAGVGWNVIRVWEHELVKMDIVLQRIRLALGL
jgi:DNA mismatch endonuclease (patch repair protein)